MRDETTARHAAFVGGEHLLNIRVIKSLEMEISSTVIMVLFHVVDDLMVYCILGIPWFSDLQTVGTLKIKASRRDEHRPQLRLSRPAEE